MISGGICSYPQGSQLAAAVSFLRDHPGQAPLITIDIGANDLNPCVVLTSLSALEACVGDTLPPVVAQPHPDHDRTPRGRRQQRADHRHDLLCPRAQRVADRWAGQEFATASEQLVVTFNGKLSNVYHQFGARIADVFSAFRSADFTDRVMLPNIGTVPRNVALICKWTWECAPRSRPRNETRTRSATASSP